MRSVCQHRRIRHGPASPRSAICRALDDGALRRRRTLGEYPGIEESRQALRARKAVRKNPGGKRMAKAEDRESRILDEYFQPVRRKPEVIIWIGVQWEAVVSLNIQPAAWPQYLGDL